MDLDILQVRTVYAKTAQNAVIPSTHILIAGGDGSTYWNSVSSIFPVSSFRTVLGNSGPSFSADVNYNTLKISTTGIRGLLESYVDPATSTMMLSNTLPASVVSLGSLPGNLYTNALSMSNAAASPPNPQSLQPITGQSTIKYLGVGDILLSTINTQNAVFFSISSFTSAGYSTISGETFRWRPTMASTMSTMAGLPSFVSSIPFVASGPGAWNWGSNLQMSTVDTPLGSVNGDVYFSTMSFIGNSYLPFITSTSKIFVEIQPNYLFSTMELQGDLTLIKPISTFLQAGTLQFGESLTTNYITSQMRATISGGWDGSSNYFVNPVRMQINTSNFSTACGSNLPITVYHRIPGAITDGSARSGFDDAVNPRITNVTSKTGGMYLHLYNTTPSTLTL